MSGAIDRVNAPPSADEHQVVRRYDIPLESVLIAPRWLPCPQHFAITRSSRLESHACVGIVLDKDGVTGHRGTAHEDVRVGLGSRPLDLAGCDIESHQIA